ncbi:biopolymer transporter ExbD [Spirulina subsalsa FACHB-351]|uniref:Biopolymer transporter ExbD n=1 Tax=Spirulina subsalsa FACHB-351 TaxID=234711 RepID=A0ABT3L5B7_9CYAN|nr:biopolymer transporter ExbD [Spirulina subsalsa]MCW6036696.1 biopolymer transporter ExbD [Spirulina subsalsa FACHB-351]
MTSIHPKGKPPKSRPLASTVQPLKLWVDSHPTQEVRIEIIPLIDVIFCILTFFILAAVGFSRQQAISLDLPRAATGAAQMREMLIVSVDDFGQVYVEQQPVLNKNQLSQTVENYFLTRPDGLMVLYASKNSRYDDVIQVLDILRSAGGDRVALATLPEGSASPDVAPMPSVPETPSSPIPTIPTPDLNSPTSPDLPASPDLPGGGEVEQN